MVTTIWEIQLSRLQSIVFYPVVKIMWNARVGGVTCKDTTIFNLLGASSFIVNFNKL